MVLLMRERNLHIWSTPIALILFELEQTVSGLAWVKRDMRQVYLVEIWYNSRTTRDHEAQAGQAIRSHRQYD
jgi:hypothetical protein